MVVNRIQLYTGAWHGSQQNTTIHRGLAWQSTEYNYTQGPGMVVTGIQLYTEAWHGSQQNTTIYRGLAW